jgi:hypothetical protein
MLTMSCSLYVWGNPKSQRKEERNNYRAIKSKSRKIIKGEGGRKIKIRKMNRKVEKGFPCRLSWEMHQK